MPVATMTIPLDAADVAANDGDGAAYVARVSQAREDMEKTREAILQGIERAAALWASARMSSGVSGGHREE